MNPPLALLGFIVLAALLLRPILLASAEMTPRQRRRNDVKSQPIELAQIFRGTYTSVPDSPSPQNSSDVQEKVASAEDR